MYVYIYIYTYDLYIYIYIYYMCTSHCIDIHIHILNKIEPWINSLHIHLCDGTLYKCRSKPPVCVYDMNSEP